MRKRIDWDKIDKEMNERRLIIHSKLDEIFNKEHELYGLCQEFKSEDITDDRFMEIHAILVKSEEDNNG